MPRARSKPPCRLQHPPKVPKEVQEVPAAPLTAAQIAEQKKQAQLRREKDMKPPKEPRIPPITKKDPEDEQQCSACGTGRELLLQVSLLARVILVGAHAAPGLPFYTGRCLRPILHAFMEGPPQSSAAAGHRPSAGPLQCCIYMLQLLLS